MPGIFVFFFIPGSTVFSLPDPSAKSAEECYSNEAQFFIYKMEEESGKNLDKSALIEDPADLRAIASLHESLEWMAARLEMFIVKIELCAPQVCTYFNQNKRADNLREFNISTNLE